MCVARRWLECSKDKFVELDCMKGSGKKEKTETFFEVGVFLQGQDYD